MNRFPTPIENIALDLMFKAVAEDRNNRTMTEYMDIAARFARTRLKEWHSIVNSRLERIHASGRPPYQICRFAAGHTKIVFEDFPRKISIQTLRTALTKSGMWMPRRR